MSDEKSKRAIHIIINPKSGSGLKHSALVEFCTLLKGYGKEIIEYRTKAPEDATRYAKSIRDVAQSVVVWGGDGTVREVASALVGSSVPMLACPVGTENLLAKELSIPSHPRRLVETLLNGRVAQCDLGIVNDRNFLMIIGVGFDGEVVRRLAAVRRGHITHLSYFWPIWRTFWEHDFPKLKIIADSEELFDDYGLAFVGNISRYAAGLRICRDARFDDGKLDLVIFSCQKQTALVLHAAWTLLRRHPLKGNVIYRQCRKIRIETDQPVPSQIDGDVGPNCPLDIGVHNSKLLLIVPPPTVQISHWPWRTELPL